MEGKKDLEEFRKTWCRELAERRNLKGKKDGKESTTQHQKSRTDISYEDFPSTSNTSSVCEDNIPSSGGKAPSSNDISKQEALCEAGKDFLFDNNIADSESDSTTEGYYPFILLGEMLKSSTSTEKCNLKNKTNESRKTSLSPTKRKYFESDDEEDLKPTLKCSSEVKRQPTSIITHNSEISERFLDLFVADLDEINEIPFFDTSLAREIAIKIFQHLSIVDLCRCSQVSKSWKSLADDELLWCEICHQLGYEDKTKTVEKDGWKNLVRSYVERRKNLITNWKNRIGKFHQFQHVQGGILCSVDSFQGTVAAGYTNCDVRFWDIEEGDNVIFKSSNTSLIIDEAVTIGTISNQVKQVVTSRKHTAASYTHGFVDVWSNEGGTEAIHTVQSDRQSINCICLSHYSPLLGIVDDVTLQVIQLHDGGNVEKLHETNTSSLVQNLKWFEPPNASISFDPKLLVAQYNKIQLLNPMDGDLIEVHNIIDSNTKCFEYHYPSATLAAGVHFFSPIAEHKVKLYDMSTKQLTGTLHGHTWIIQCLSLPVEQPDWVVSGSCDRKIRLYDRRMGSQPAKTYMGHSESVTTVQADDWKIVSSDVAGFVSVRDIRTSKKIWELHNRHPVEYCCFSDRYLTVGNIPTNKFTQIDMDLETDIHRKRRGTVQVYDFLSGQAREDLPDICLSTYDQPDAYNFNIRLAMPYDSL